MLYYIIKYWKTKRAKFYGALFKILYANKSIRIGKDFTCDSFPEINLTQNGQIQIGDNVHLRRNVELRSHNNSTLTIGDNIRIDRGVRILAANDAKIKIGDFTRIGLYSVLNGGSSISIGKKCLISGFVYLQTSMHRHKAEGNIQDQGYDHAEIIIEDNAWLGAHVVILPGVKLESGAIVGSNAVVNKNVEANQIVGGVPAKPLKKKD